MCDNLEAAPRMGKLHIFRLGVINESEDQDLEQRQLKSKQKGSDPEGRHAKKTTLLRVVLCQK